MKAQPESQQALLQLQAIDTSLDRVRHRLRTLPERAEVEALTKAAGGLRDDLVAARTQVQDLTRALNRAEDDVASVRARAERDRVLLASGEITAAKQLTDLEHEVTSLGRRQAELEDAELELMESVEEATEGVRAAEEAQAANAESLAAATARRDEAQSALVAEQEALAADRVAAVLDVPADLLALYDRIRGDGSPVAAGLVRYGRCEACQMELSRADLDAVRAAPADEVVRCPECRSIMVRTEESGL